MASGQTPLEKRICLFTDHLDGASGFSYKEVARMLAQLGVSGPDLTVRRGGLVKAERVTEDLPKAAAIFKDHGLTIPMITTSLTTAAEARDVLEVASQAGIKYYKVGYMRYEDMDHWRERRARARKDLEGLVRLGKRLGMHAGFHNHSGPIVGGTLWDCFDLVERHDRKWLGIFFDIAHATIEGGKNGWNIGFRRIRNRVTMVAIKDFVWEKVKGTWRTRWVPLGEGMVPFAEYIPLLLQTRFPGPLSLHIEYDPGGKTKAERFDRSFEAAARDLKFLREQLRGTHQRV